MRGQCGARRRAQTNMISLAAILKQTVNEERKMHGLYPLEKWML